MARPAKDAAKELAPEKKTYFAVGVRKYRRPIPVRDENGSLIRRTDALGNPVYDGGKPMYQTRDIVFKEAQSRKIGEDLIKACWYSTSDPYEIEILDGDVEDPRVSVRTQQQFDAWLNPAAEVEKAKRIKLETELEVLKGQLSDAQKVIVDQDAQLAQLTKPKGDK